jgi:hypothetical protein
MSEKTKDYLKSRFEAGDVPSSTDFSDLIDSTYSAGVSSLSGSIFVTNPSVYNGTQLINFTTSLSATSGSANIPSKAHGFITIILNNSSVKIPYFI